MSEKLHGAFVDFLIEEYGIPQTKRGMLFAEVEKVWERAGVIHALLLLHIRGQYDVSGARPLLKFISTHNTRRPK